MYNETILENIANFVRASIIENSTYDYNILSIATLITNRNVIEKAFGASYRTNQPTDSIQFTHPDYHFVINLSGEENTYKIAIGIAQAILEYEYGDENWQTLTSDTKYAPLSNRKNTLKLATMILAPKEIYEQSLEVFKNEDDAKDYFGLIDITEQKPIKA